MVEAAGYVPVALSADDYVELLPACWHAVNAYGIKVSRRWPHSRSIWPHSTTGPRRNGRRYEYFSGHGFRRN